jgi:hypothetical protein
MSLMEPKDEEAIYWRERWLRACEREDDHVAVKLDDFIEDLDTVRRYRRALEEIANPARAKEASAIASAALHEEQR